MNATIPYNSATVAFLPPPQSSPISKMGDQSTICSYKKPILIIRLSAEKWTKLTLNASNNMSPKIRPSNKLPWRKPVRSNEYSPATCSRLIFPQGSSSLGSAWTETDVQQLYDLRQANKSWNQIGKIIKRSGGAAQQQWMRVCHPRFWTVTIYFIDFCTDATRKSPS